MGLRLPCRKNSAYLIENTYFRKAFSGLEDFEGFIITGEKTAYFTDARYFSEAKDKITSRGFEAVLFDGEDCLRNYLKKHRIKTLYVDFDNTTLTRYNSLKKLGVKIKDGSFDLKVSRSVKSDEEIDLIKTASEISEKVILSAINSLKEGITEIELKNKIQNDLTEFGADGEAFDTIVAFGKNSAVPHHVSDSTLLKKDSVVLIDMGATYKGYASDITRTVFFGTPTEKFAKCYDAVKTANELVIEKAKSGDLYKNIDWIARGYLQKEGLDKYFTHSLGHGLGLEIHEFPKLSPLGEANAMENVVFTVEPGVYFENEFGIRIEDTVVIKDGRIKRLTVSAKDLLTI